MSWDEGTRGNEGLAPRASVTSLVPAVGWESGHSWQVLIELQLYLDEK